MRKVDDFFKLGLQTNEEDFKRNFHFFTPLCIGEIIKNLDRH